MDTNTKKKGFNNGYYLKTHAPALADKFAKAMKDRSDDYAIAFMAGISEREKEKTKSRTSNYKLRGNLSHDKSRDRDKNLDKDVRDR